MGQQSNKVIKRRRRVNYLKRKKEQAKSGITVKKTVPKKKSAEPAKKTAVKKAAKKAPAKKVAKKAVKKAVEADTPEVSEE